MDVLFFFVVSIQNTKKLVKHNTLSSNIFKHPFWIANLPAISTTRPHLRCLTLLWMRPRQGLETSLKDLWLECFTSMDRSSMFKMPRAQNVHPKSTRLPLNFVFILQEPWLSVFLCHVTAIIQEFWEKETSPAWNTWSAATWALSFNVAPRPASFFTSKDWWKSKRLEPGTQKNWCKIEKWKGKWENHLNSMTLGFDSSNAGHPCSTGQRPKTQQLAKLLSTVGQGCQRFRKRVVMKWHKQQKKAQGMKYDRFSWQEFTLLKN